jgi:hypothetical protein
MKTSPIVLVSRGFSSFYLRVLFLHLILLDEIKVEFLTHTYFVSR